MDKAKQNPRDEQFPRPLPHPVFFAWATIIGLVGVVLWNLRLGRTSEGIVLVAMILLIAVGLIRRKK